MDIDSADSTNFKLSFETTNSIRTLTDIVSNVLKNVELQVVKTPTFEGIKIESIDAKQVCLIVAHLRCTVEKCEEDTKWCVDTGILNTCLKSVPQHYSLDISNAPNSSDIFLHAYESLSQTYTTRFKLPTLVSEVDRVTLSDLDYSYTIEIDLTTLRSIVRNTLALRGSDILLRVEEPNSASNHRHTILSIISEGNAEQHHMFHSVTDTNDGNACVIRTDQNEISATYDSPLVKKYEEVFSASYLNDFLKSMERHIITMKLSPKKPLILTYPLGGDESYVCFVLAPRAEL